MNPSTFQNPSGHSPYNYENKNTPAETMFSMNPDDRLDILHQPDVESIVLFHNDVCMQLYHPTPILADNGDTFITGFLGNETTAPLVRIPKSAFAASIETFIEKHENESMHTGRIPINPDLFPQGPPHGMDITKMHTALMPIWTVKPMGHYLDPFTVDEMDREDRIFAEMRMMNWINGLKIHKGISGGSIPHPTTNVQDAQAHTDKTGYNDIVHTPNMPIQYIMPIDAIISPRVYNNLQLKRGLYSQPQQNTNNATPTPGYNPQQMQTPAPSQPTTPTGNQLTYADIHAIINPPKSAKEKEENLIAIATWQMFTAYKDDESATTLTVPFTTTYYDNILQAGSRKTQNTILRNTLNNNQRLVRDQQHRILSNIHLPPANDITCGSLINCSFRGTETTGAHGMTFQHFKHPNISSIELQLIQNDMDTQTLEEQADQHADKRAKKSTSTYTDGKEATVEDLLGAISNFILVINTFMATYREPNGTPKSAIQKFAYDFGVIFGRQDFRTWIDTGMHQNKYTWIPHIILNNISHIVKVWYSAACSWDHVQDQMKNIKRQTIPTIHSQDIIKAYNIMDLFKQNLEHAVAGNNYTGYDKCPSSFKMLNSYPSSSSSSSSSNRRDSFSNPRTRNNTNKPRIRPSTASDPSKGYIQTLGNRQWCVFVGEAKDFCNHWCILQRWCKDPTTCKWKHPKLDDFTKEVCATLNQEWIDRNNVKLVPAIQQRVDAYRKGEQPPASFAKKDTSKKDGKKKSDTDNSEEKSEG